MPWAINIPYEWQHPVEYMDIKYAYPNFHSFVTSSGGLNLDWFTVEKLRRVLLTTYLNNKEKVIKLC
jgi:hypothetical protein